jgi:hypothetical protein
LQFFLLPPPFSAGLILGLFLVSEFVLGFFASEKGAERLEKAKNAQFVSVELH